MNKKITQILPIIVFSILLIIGIVCRQLFLHSYDNLLAKSKQDLTDMRNERDMQNQKRVNAKQELLNKTTGLDLARQAHDDEIATKMFEDIFTWSDFKEYNQKQKAMLKKYHISEDIVRRLMPDVKEIDTGDKKINEVDAYHLNMRFTGLKSFVTKISGTDYSYLTEVGVASKDELDNEASGKILMSYNVSLNGKVDNIIGFTLMN